MQLKHGNVFGSGQDLSNLVKSKILDLLLHRHARPRARMCTHTRNNSENQTRGNNLHHCKQSTWQNRRTSGNIQKPSLSNYAVATDSATPLKIARRNNANKWHMYHNDLPGQTAHLFMQT